MSNESNLPSATPLPAPHTSPPTFWDRPNCNQLQCISVFKSIPFFLPSFYGYFKFYFLMVFFKLHFILIKINPPPPPPPFRMLVKALWTMLEKDYGTTKTTNTCLEKEHDDGNYVCEYNMQAHLCKHFLISCRIYRSCKRTYVVV